MTTMAEALAETPSRIGTESHENPFMADGELSHKAEYILRNSTISRTELKIADPDSAKKAAAAEPAADDSIQEETIQLEEISKVESAPPMHASPGDQMDGNAARPNDIKVKENGKMEEPLTPQSVEVEVGQANATQAEPQQAEQVKLKDNKKCKCCVVM